MSSYIRRYPVMFRFVVVVVELPQAPEDDPQKRKSCAWKAVGLVTVSVCVW